MWWGYDGGMGWWVVFGGLWMLFFWGLIIGLVVWSVNRVTGSHGNGRSVEETPREIARKRLARGEITTEQFEELRKTLQ
ncbi:MAG: SHOCT domain-containing protein [Chloroflexi bacterium]|nr:SHOCT domain-containing protein [Chloroflexota bacterium]